MRISFKWIVAAVLLVFILIIAAIYIAIPSTLTVSKVEKMNCNTAAAGRVVNTKWQQLFRQHNDSNFINKGYTYIFSKKLKNAADIIVNYNDNLYATTLVLIPLSRDSCIVHWQTTVATGANPFGRISAYKRAIALKENMNESLNQLKLFLEKTSNVYGYNITPTTLTDTVLISTKRLSKTYPATTEVYNIVHELQGFIHANSAIETNYPMLNVTKTDSGYITMVGIPINKELPASGDIYPKHLAPMKDKTLTADVTGGEATVKQAYQQIELYMQDHSLRSPVIPFELMITDRSKEKDTSKWKTKIYYPII